jgi:Tfp pilus assembly protein PilE
MGLSLAPRLVAIAALLLGLAAGCWKLYHTGYQAGVNATQATYQAQALEAERQARATERAKTIAVNSVQVKHEQTKQTAAAAAAAADTELDRLRALLATPTPAPQPTTPDPTTTARTDDATRARAVVGQCASALTSMAATADALEARLSGLQDYVTRVCLAPPPAK